MNPPNQEFDEIEGRGVGPMDIFEDQHGRTRRLLEFVQHRAEQHRSVGPVAQHCLKACGSFARQVVQRTEWMGRKQRFTGTRENALRNIFPNKMFDQKGLPDTGFPTD